MNTEKMGKTEKKVSIKQILNKQTKKLNNWFTYIFIKQRQLLISVTTKY